MKKIKLFSLVFFALFVSVAVEAQFAVGTDIVSSYVWRGLPQGSTHGGTPNFQPYLSYTAGGFSIGSWASGSFDGGIKEVDLYATYAISPLFSVTVTDYNYGFASTGAGNQKYFNYDNDKTDHIIELTAAYAGVKAFPLSLSLNTMVYGADKKVNSSGDLKQAYSTYFELGYPLSSNAKVFAGGSLGKSPNTYYTDGFNFTNIGLKVSKSIEITDKFSLPVYGILGFNPNASNAYFVVGISL